MNSVKLPGYSEPVDTLDSDHRERLLGVRLAINGNDADELQFRIDQVDELAEKIRAGP